MMPEAGAAGPGGWTPAQIRKLKIAVIAMGILLVLGFGLLIAGLFYQAGKLGSQKAGTVANANLANAAQTEIKLQPGSEIGSITAAGNALAVHIKKPGGDEIYLIDTGSGRLIGKVLLKPE